MNTLSSLLYLTMEMYKFHLSLNGEITYSLRQILLGWLVPLYAADTGELFYFCKYFFMKTIQMFFSISDFSLFRNVLTFNFCKLLHMY